MAYGTPTDPVAGTVITVAYMVANALNPIRALRTFTGGADPPGSNYVVTSDSTSATSWKTMAAAVLAAIGYTPVNKAGDSVPFLNFSSYLAWTIAANHVWTATVGGNALILQNATTGVTFAITSAGAVTVAGGVVWTSANDAALAKLAGAAFVGSISAINNISALNSGATSGAFILHAPSNVYQWQFTADANNYYITSTSGGGQLIVPKSSAGNIVFATRTVWDSGNDGPGSGLAADTAATATLAATATNALALGGVAAAGYPTLGGGGNFTTAPTIGSDAIAKIAYGNYTGTGGAARQIATGFVPKYVRITGRNGASTILVTFDIVAPVAGVIQNMRSAYISGVSSMQTLTDTYLHASDGFVVYGAGADGSDNSGLTYYWVAFG